MEMDLQLMVEMGRDIPVRYGFIGAILGGIASAVVGGILSKSSAKATNTSNQAIAQQETEANMASAREANALTDKLSLRATKSTEGMTASALALSKSQFDQSQAFNERMSNTAYTRGIVDLRNAGLNPILAATRGQTSSPTVSGGAAPSGSGTGGSGTAARVSPFRKIDAGLQALNSAAAIGRVTEEIKAMSLANKARERWGVGVLANQAETIAKTSKTIKKRAKSHIVGPGMAAGKRVIAITKHKLKDEWKSTKAQARRNAAARGPRSNWGMWDKSSPYNRRNK